jgi:MFS family permease
VSRFSAYRAAFARRDFRRLWLGFTISVFGDSFTQVAFVWFVLEKTRSPEALGLLMAAFTGPVLASGIIAGLLLDRFDRRLILTLDTVLRGIAIGMVPLLHALGALELWHIYAAAAAYGLGMMIPLAGIPALIPALVRADQLDTANALETLSYTLAGLIGPLVAGLMVAEIGAAPTVAVDALSYLVFAAALRSLGAFGPARASAAAPQSPPPHESARRALLHPVLIATTLMFLACNIGAGAKMVWLPVLCDRLSQDGPRLYGLLLALIAAGQTASALATGALRIPPERLGIAIALFQSLAGASLLLVALSSGLWTAAAAMLFFGAFSAPLTVWAQTLRMRILPERLRGRAFALLRTIMQGGNPLGGMLGGALFPLVGLAATAGASALLIAIPGLVGLALPALRSPRLAAAALPPAELKSA